MGRIFVLDLEGSTYRCKFCKNQLARVDDLVSREFRCPRGNAYSFNKVANVTMGPVGEMMNISGMHAVADIFCCSCGQKVGTKYDSRVKTPKFVLEREKILDAEKYIDNINNPEDA